MKQAFIIMQIGNKELDDVCKEAIVPALRTSNLDPKRVDKHNKGGLLKSEIITFINESDIIVADLTNERPNCYLEVGYAMGRDKYPNLILTAREDHNPDSPNRAKGTPKVHFDLTGYDILWWEKEKLGAFKEELEKRIKRRLSAVSTSGKTTDSPMDTEWINISKNEAFYKFEHRGNVPFMEAEMALIDFKLNIEQDDLLRIAEKAVIRTTCYGLPIGAVLSADEKRPKPTKYGIVARISSCGGNCHDYWALRKDGQFYLMRAEDVRKGRTLAFDTTIIRITEVLLYCTQLYAGLGASPNARVFVRIHHYGLTDCVISADGKRAILDNTYRSMEHEACTEIITTLGEIKANITDFVETFVKPLFVLFNYFSVSKEVLEEIVNNFVQGKV